MAELLIRDLKPDTRELLRRRAKASGRSLDAEVRSILDSAALASDVDTTSEPADLFPPGSPEPTEPEGDLEPEDSPPRLPNLYRHDAAIFSYTAGALGAAAFMALSIGPGWLGFVVGYLPASLLAAWVLSDYA